VQKTNAQLLELRDVESQLRRYCQVFRLFAHCDNDLCSPLGKLLADLCIRFDLHGSFQNCRQDPSSGFENGDINGIGYILRTM
jgi:hypothetical protein